MSTEILRLEDIYERLYEISKQIEELIDRELYNELGKYFTKKDQLLSVANEIIEKANGLQASEKLKEIAANYQSQEKKNIERLEKIKEETRAELLNTSKNAKLVGAYRENKENVKGNILDFSE